MRYENVIKYFHTMYYFQKLTGMSVANCVYWKKVGYIPFSMQQRIEKFTGGKLKASQRHGRKWK